MTLFSTNGYPQKPCPGLDSLNYGGRWYHTVQIGSQCWLKENLNVGMMIKVYEQQKDNNLIEKYCQREDSDNCEKLGGLYQWDEAMHYDTTEGAQGICPQSWHMPSSNEIDTLIKSVNNNGKALTVEQEGTNSSGFSIIGDAVRMENNGKAYFMGNSMEFGYFWSSTEQYDKLAIYFSLGTTGDIGSGPVGKPRKNIYNKYIGLPIRCLKDNY